MKDNRYVHWNEFELERATQQLTQVTGSQVTPSTGLQWADGLGNSIFISCNSIFYTCRKFP